MNKVKNDNEQHSKIISPSPECNKSRIKAGIAIYASVYLPRFYGRNQLSQKHLLYSFGELTMAALSHVGRI